MGAIAKKTNKSVQKVETKTKLNLKKNKLNGKGQKVAAKPVKAIEKKSVKSIEHVKIKNKNTEKPKKNAKKPEEVLEKKIVVNLQEAVQKAKKFATEKSANVIKDVEKSIVEIEPEAINDGVKLNVLIPKEKIESAVKNWLKIIDREKKNATVSAFGEGTRNLQLQITPLRMASCPRRSVRV